MLKSISRTSCRVRPTVTRRGLANGALSGIRVLDLSRVLAGPWSTQILGDLGAEVIKIEAPGKGDDTRQWGPPYIKDDNSNTTKESSYFVSANRSKKSVIVDLAHPEGQRIVKEIASKSDVFVENFKVGGLKKYGLDYESIQKVNPRLVYCSITGFGQNGPRAQEPGYDFMIQGMGGLMSITGNEEPIKVGVAATDMMTGMYATTGILSALLSRNMTGMGQHVDIALFDVQVAYLGYRAQDFLDSGKVPQRLGNAHPNIVPYNSFETKDGYIIIAVGNDSQFRSLCEVMAIPEIGTDEKFKTNPLRVKNRAELTSLLTQITKSETTDTWVRRLSDNGNIPYSPINTIDKTLKDPQVRERNMIASVPHSLKPSGLSVIANPLKLSNTPIDYSAAERSIPTLGQHTRTVLKEILGYSDAELDRLTLLKAIS